MLARAALLLILTAAPALAHGPAAWIERGAYRNKAGELCCGERDCGLKVGGTIDHVAGGYQVKADFQIGDGAGATIIHREEFVPEGDATPSPDESYWRCEWGGARKCFFAPMPGT